MIGIMKWPSSDNKEDGDWLGHSKVGSSAVARDHMGQEAEWAVRFLEVTQIGKRGERERLCVILVLGD